MSIVLKGAAQRDEAGATLRRASGELRKAVNMVEDLEQVVSYAIALSGEAQADQMLELQKLDHLQQKILGVADFLDALSRGMPRDWTVDAKGASRCVLHAELGARLGCARVVTEAVRTQALENYELF